MGRGSVLIGKHILSGVQSLRRADLGGGLRGLRTVGGGERGTCSSGVEGGGGCV